MSEEDQIEETLNKDFLSLLSLIKTYSSEIDKKEQKTLCEQWLMKLCGERAQGICQKRNRNIFLIHLLMNMQERKLESPFLKPPTDELLALAQQLFGPNDEISLPQTEGHIGKTTDDFQERSADGRTYVALRCLPDNQGAYAFVALNLDTEDETDPTVTPCSDNSRLRYLKTLHRISTLDTCKTSSEDFHLRNIESQISGNLSEFIESFDAPTMSCGRRNEKAAFYDLLLKQIDDEIKGNVSESHNMIQGLINKMTKDLEKIPKMKYLFELTAAQRNLKILEILRQKLIVWRQEEKHINLLTEMEERTLASSACSKHCQREINDQTESMWKLIVTRPLSDSDAAKLYHVYPKEAVSTFLRLLVKDREIILEKGKEKEKDTLESMRSEVYKEIQSGKAEYSKARAMYREWHEILSTVEELTYEAGHDVARARNNDAPEENEEILMNMISEIKETEDLIAKEVLRGEGFIQRITDLNTWAMASTRNDDKQDVSWKLRSLIESKRQEIELYKTYIAKQNQKIKELQRRIKYTQL